MEKNGKGYKQNVDFKRTDHPMMEIWNIADLFKIIKKRDIVGNCSKAGYGILFKKYYGKDEQIKTEIDPKQA